MRRVVSLYLPQWSTDLVRRRLRRALRCGPPEAAGAWDGGPPPILLVTIDHQRQVVARCCERAAACGVRPGMTLAHARALLPPKDHGRVVVEDLDPKRDEAALRRLADWAVRFTPLVMADPPDGLLLDITGCEHLFGGERELLRALARGVRRLGVRCRLAAAPTFGCAWAVARFGPFERSIVHPGRAADAVRPLPVAALRISPEVESALHEVGIERVEHLMALPRGTLPSRFGPDLLVQLDRATVESELIPDQAIDPVRPTEPPRAQMLFSGPTTQCEAVHEAARRVLDDLCRRLETMESGTRLIDLRLLRVSAEPVVISLSMSRPTRSLRHLWSLARPHLERAHLGFGVEGVVATAQRLARLPHEQLEHADGQWVDAEGADRRRCAQAVGELVDTLAGRLGTEAVMVVEMNESHVPERAFRVRPAAGALGVLAQEEGAAPHAPYSGIRKPPPEPPPPVSPASRPTILLSEPEPAEVMALVPDGPPTWMRWRGREVRLRAGIGPERIAGEWWREGQGEGSRARSERATDRRSGATAAAPAPGPACSAPACLSHRDYFRVQDDTGLWMWVYRESDGVGAGGRWFVHGVWG